MGIERTQTILNDTTKEEWLTASSAILLKVCTATMTGRRGTSRTTKKNRDLFTETRKMTTAKTTITHLPRALNP
jgi:hypothetical protein